MDKARIREEGKAILRELGLEKPDEQEHLQALQDHVPKGNYADVPQITFYTEHLERKNYYKSVSLGLNPFAKSSGVTQPVQETRGVCNYEANVNFGRETAVHEKLSTTRNLFVENPYQSYPVKTIYTHEDLKAVFNEMSGDYTFGLRQIRKFLKDCDRNRNGYLDPGEFKVLLRRLGLSLEEENMKVVLKHLDRNKDGKASIDEFLGLFTDALTESRKNVIAEVYGKLAGRSPGGRLTFGVLVNTLDPKIEPAYEQGRVDLDMVKKMFIGLWAPHKYTDYIPESEFTSFCGEAGYQYKSDAELEAFLSKVWNL